MQFTPLAQWLTTAPLWWIGLVLLAAMSVAAALGSALRIANLRKTPEDRAPGEKGGQEDYILSAVLGLLALLMGFTFSLAIDRYEARRMLVVEEAAAIRAVYLHTQLLDEPHRGVISRTLAEYVDNRIALATAARSRVPPLLASNNVMVTKLWGETIAAFPTIKGFDFSSTYVDSMNQALSFSLTRLAGRMARVPSQVYVVLFIYVITAVGVLGYVLTGPRGRTAAAFLMLLITLSLVLILDIDRPNDGLINEGQGPMIMLKAAMAREPPAAFTAVAGAPVVPAATPAAAP